MSTTFEQLLSSLQAADARARQAAATLARGLAQGPAPQILVPAHQPDAHFAVSVQVALENLAGDIWGHEARRRLADFFDQRLLADRDTPITTPPAANQPHDTPTLPELDTTSPWPLPRAAA
jgi:hypothetical protein